MYITRQYHDACTNTASCSVVGMCAQKVIKHNNIINMLYLYTYLSVRSVIFVRRRVGFDVE